MAILEDGLFKGLFFLVRAILRTDLLLGSFRPSVMKSVPGELYRFPVPVFIFPVFFPFFYPDPKF